MDKIAQLEQQITKNIMKINQGFPELSKYINEIPIKSFGSNSKEIDVEGLKAYNSSLVELIEKYSITHIGTPPKRNQKPFLMSDYPASEDIYNKEKYESEINPEDISKKKITNEIGNNPNEKGFEDDMSGDDLDVPGSELDDKQEQIGSEDEENNYYSLGGDNHNDLEENTNN